jgi:hypothetical protein
MRGTFKAFGLALVAALALSAVTAAGAQAETPAQFTKEGGGKATITGHQEGAKNLFTITTGAGQTKRELPCTTATYEATLPQTQATLTVTPHYTGCTEPTTGAKIDVDLNGCHFEVTAGTYTKVPDEAHGTTHVICPPGKQIETTWTIGGAVVCTIDIPAQANKATLTFTNKAPVLPTTPKPWVTVDANVTGIKYVETKNSVVCPMTNNFTSENGIFESEVKVKGYEDTGSHVGNTVDDSGKSISITTYTEGAEVGIHVR